jgi:hypothetical protein
MTIPTTPGTLGRTQTTMLRRVAVIGALALTLVCAAVPAASASQDEQITTKRGEVEFEGTGDIIRALDKRRDGYGVRARLKWFDPITRTLEKAYLTDPSSAGTWKSKRLAIPEGITVRLRMCYVNNGHAFKCSKEQEGVA